MKGKIFLAAITGLSSLLFIGCGNNAGKGKNQSGQVSMAQVTGTVYGSNGYTCPSLMEPNVFTYPRSSVEFTVCVSNQSNALLEVHGQIAAAQLCVFPAVSDPQGTTIQVFRDATAGNLPIYRCVAPDAQGAHLNFTGLPDFNAAFVTDSVNVTLVQECLRTWNFAACQDRFAYGKYR